VGAKNLSSSRDLGRLKRVEGDMGANSIKLGLAAGGKDLIIQIKAQEDRNKKGRESLLGKLETIKVVSKLGEGAPRVEPNLRTSDSLEKGRL